MDLDKVKELIQLLEESDISELEVEEEGQRIRLSKQPPQIISAYPPQADPLSVAPQTHNAPAQAPPSTEEEVHNGLLTIVTPMVGTFYLAPSPGDPPFVLPGDTVEPGQTVCIVEAMKIMNEITAKVPGIIEEVLVESGAPVEFGQALFTVAPIA